MQVQQKLGSKRLYQRIFDLDADPKGGWTFVAPLQLIDTPEAPAIVPVVFLTPRSLPELDAITRLASDLLQKFAHYRSRYQKMGKRVPELQLDCDWTATTQERFFRLVELVATQLDTLPVSCTIRLHQLRLEGPMEAPPAARGVLMFYNTGRFDDPEESNSILNLEVAEAYLPALSSYPLPLDLALPLFGWGVRFREGHFVDLHQQLTQEKLVRDSLLAQTDSTHFVVTRSHYLDGTYVYRGDEIRYEHVRAARLRAAINLYGRFDPPNTPRRLLFYDLNGASSWNIHVLEHLIEDAFQ